jgi:hypothetical protein
MKEFKVMVRTLEVITVQAESAEAALDQAKKGIDPRVLGGPTEIEVLETESEADSSASQNP